MRKLIGFSILILIVFTNVVAQQNDNKIYYIENKGQIVNQFGEDNSEVLFIGKTEKEHYVIGKTKVSHQLVSPERNTVHRVDMNWLNSNSKPTFVKSERSIDYFNYYNLKNKSDGIFKVFGYADVILKDVYNGIDVRYYSNKGNVEYDYEVSPGADFEQIKIQVSGADAFVNRDGDLEMRTPLGIVLESAPKVFQNGILLISKWVDLGGNTWGFEIENYNKELALLIDPIATIWATYYGGESDDLIFDVVVDSDENIYTSGTTSSLINIATTGSHQTVLDTSYGLKNGFLTKFDKNGVRQWATYYGNLNINGTFDASNSHRISIDGNSNVFLAFTTKDSLNTNATIGSHQQNFGGGLSDGMLLKFDSNGNRLWGTYYGGNSVDEVNSCKVDKLGNVYIGGRTSSTNNMSTSGSFQESGGASSGFITKFNNNGVREWATYYGNWSRVNEMTIDENNNLYIVGNVESSGSNLSSTGAHQINFSGMSDGFIARFNSYGNRIWGTYYGDVKDDRLYGCSVDLEGNLLISGSSNSLINIATSGAYSTTLSNTNDPDMILLKFDTLGNRIWGTYVSAFNLVGSYEKGLQCFTDDSLNIFLSGYSWGGTLTKFNSYGQYQYSKYFGNSGGIRGTFFDKYLYVVGTTTNPNSYFNSTLNSHQSNFGGGILDGHISKLIECNDFNPNLSFNYKSTICQGDTISIEFSPQLNNYDYVWDPPQGSLSVNNPFININPNVFDQGEYYLTTTSDFGCSYTDTININVIGEIRMVISQSPQHDLQNQFCYFNNPPFFVEDVDIQLSASTPNIFQWTVSWNDSVQDGATFTLPVGDTYYSFEATHISGCTVTVGDTLHLDPKPIVAVNSNLELNQLNGNYEICEGEELVLNATGALTYVWESWSQSQGAIYNFPINNVPFIPENMSSYIVRGTDENGCEGMSVIDPVIVIPAPNVTMSPLLKNPICLKDNPIPLPSVSPVGGTWLGVGVDGNNYNPNWANLGNHTLTYQVTSAEGCVGEDSEDVLVVESPDFNYHTNGNSVTLQANNSCANYYWDFGDGSTNNLTLNPAHTYSSAGVYTVCMVCQDIAHCANCINLIYPSNVSGTVNGVIGVEEVINELEFSLYPNPNSGILNIIYNNELGGKELKIYNISGKLIETLLLKQGENSSQIDISSLSNGLYLISINTERGIITSKLIKN